MTFQMIHFTHVQMLPTEYRFSNQSKGPTPNFTTTVNPLQAGVAFLYPLKTSENLKVF